MRVTYKSGDDGVTITAKVMVTNEIKVTLIVWHKGMKRTLIVKKSRTWC